MRTCLLAVMMSLVASPSLSQQCSEAEQARLREFDKAWADATNRGDRAQLDAIFADDFASTDINGSQNKATTIDAAVQVAERRRSTGQTAPPTVYDNYTKREYLESIRADKSVLESIELLEPNVRIDGNTAIITGINRTRGRDPQGKPFDRRALFTGTWVKRDGRWMVRAFQGTAIP
jgi:ketosteroid isomerase-like protein